MTTGKDADVCKQCGRRMRLIFIHYACDHCDGLIESPPETDTKFKSEPPTDPSWTSLPGTPNSPNTNPWFKWVTYPKSPGPNTVTPPPTTVPKSTPKSVALNSSLGYRTPQTHPPILHDQDPHRKPLSGGVGELLHSDCEHAQTFGLPRDPRL